jgi:hypothetical protein
MPSDVVRDPGARQNVQMSTISPHKTWNADGKKKQNHKQDHDIKPIPIERPPFKRPNVNNINGSIHIATQIVL